MLHVVSHDVITAAENCLMSDNVEDLLSARTSDPRTPEFRGFDDPEEEAWGSDGSRNVFRFLEICSLNSNAGAV